VHGIIDKKLPLNSEKLMKRLGHNIRSQKDLKKKDFLEVFILS